MKMSRFFRKLKAQKKNSGQAILESLLLLGIITVAWMGALKIIKSNQFFETIFGQPWGRLANVIEFGVPVADQKQAGTKHPTSYARHSSHTETQ